MPLTSWAITQGRYHIVDGERYSVVRIEGYLRALRRWFAAAARSSP